MAGASRQNGTLPPGVVLNQEFFARDTVEVARDVLGKLLMRRVRGHERWGRIVEVEAYLGPDDKAAHSFKGHRSPRNDVMFGTAGHAYVYFTYGMHHCLNFVTREPGVPQAVLIRALEPGPGVGRCMGPGLLCRALE
ncbi:MAG: DNA-3-methyladenine glycosylase, partial [Streptosporangiaceae bacterium]